jgi:16S rRNA (cytosine967-C5)-methyltransferase
LKTARPLAHRALAVYDRAGGPLRDLLEERGFDAPPAERAFARDLALGVVQRLNTLDWALASVSNRALSSLSPDVRAALRLGAYQLLFAGGRVPAYAAVNESVTLAGPKAAPFVNAVLRNLQRKPQAWPTEVIERLCVQHSHPAWLVRRWAARWGAATAEKILEAGNAAPPLFLRANRLKTTPAELAERLSAEGRKAAPTALSPDGVRVEESFSLTDSPSFQKGLFSVQDEAAQLAVAALDPTPGETVLDLCAGVGGKSAHMAERMGNRGRVVAVDTNGERLKTLASNASRLGVTIIAAKKGDARKGAGLEADRVLVDAPCSGLGTLRRRPDIKWAREEKDVAERLPVLQGEILAGAASSVKRGGLLAYATCTTEPEENEGVVSGFLKAHAGFAAAPLPPGFPADADGFVRLRPDLHGTDGFFIALLRRTQ